MANGSSRSDAVPGHWKTWTFRAVANRLVVTAGRVVLKSSGLDTAGRATVEVEPMHPDAGCWPSRDGGHLCPFRAAGIGVSPGIDAVHRQLRCPDRGRPQPTIHLAGLVLTARWSRHAHLGHSRAVAEGDDEEGRGPRTIRERIVVDRTPEIRQHLEEHQRKTQHCRPIAQDLTERPLTSDEVDQCPNGRSADKTRERPVEQVPPDSEEVDIVCQAADERATRRAWGDFEERNTGLYKQVSEQIRYEVRASASTHASAAGPRSGVLHFREEVVPDPPDIATANTAPVVECFVP